MKKSIAIFDSGLGGLTVVAQLRQQLPKDQEPKRMNLHSPYQIKRKPRLAELTCLSD